MKQIMHYIWKMRKW